MIQGNAVRGLVCAISVSLSHPGLAQVSSKPDKVDTFAVPSAESTIAAARKLIADKYVLPEVAGRLDQALAQAASAGVFQGLSGNALAARVNAEMRKVTSDVHLQMQYAPQLAAMLESSSAGGATKAKGWDKALGKQLQSTNAGIRKLEVLPGNIRYLEYESFGWGAPVAQQAIATAMDFLRDGDAIIMDLRNNAGGSTYAETAIASYFLPPNTNLTRFEMRGLPNETTKTTRAPFSLAGKPTFLLVGPATVSAAEEFAVHASTFGFGTLVGSKTRGGGYTIRGIPLPGGYVLNVSVGRALDAHTGTDWEGVGVAPKIVVAPDKALVAAQAAAMEMLVTNMSGTGRAQAERLLAFYRASARPIASTLPLDDYAGRYGDFIVEVQGRDLTIRFRDFSPEVLIPIAPNAFVPEPEPTTQIRFVVDGKSVVALELDGGNGPPARAARTPNAPSTSAPGN